MKPDFRNEPNLNPLVRRTMRIIESWGNWRTDTLDDISRLEDCAFQISRELWEQGFLDIDEIRRRQR